MPWIIKADSDIGDREQQQDGYLVKSTVDGLNHLLVVADGAGGHKAGAAAAKVAIDCVQEHLENLYLSEDTEEFLKKLIIQCNQHVLKVGDAEMACTTLVLVLIKGDEIFWGHVGDSRFYLIRNGNVAVKTTDHSVVELQTNIVPEEGITQPLSASSNKLYMCLGASNDIEPEVASSLVKEGDTLLLCSDGLWGQLDMSLMIDRLSKQTLATVSLKDWIDKARISKPNHSDNITLIAASLLKDPHFSTSVIKKLTRFFKK